MASAHRLDSLPLELREKIVSLGSYETLLQLSRTNRALHQACSSTHVVKAILHNHNGCGGQKWRYPRLLMDDPVSEWARYALADLKANEAGSNGGRVAPYSRAMLWAPQLMALQHPFISTTTREEPITAKVADKDDVYSNIANSFCLVMKSLSRARKVEDLAIPTLLGIASARQKLSDFFNRMSEESPTAHEHFGKPCIIGAARQAYLAFECFVLALVEKHVREPPQGTWSGMNYLHSRLAPNYLAVPDSYSIPFSDFMDLPLPFTEDATENFATCHLRQMTEPSFLEDGEWAGYYSVDIGEESTTTFDPPMHNIRFIVGEPNEESLPIVGTGGRDGVGSFTLDGVMDSNTGALMIKKDYDNYGPHWIWTGFLTPFGIIASWGTATWGGWVWLYKEEWCPRDTP